MTMNTIPNRLNNLIINDVPPGSYGVHVLPSSEAVKAILGGWQDLLYLQAQKTPPDKWLKYRYAITMGAQEERIAFWTLLYHYVYMGLTEKAVLQEAWDIASKGLGTSTTPLATFDDLAAVYTTQYRASLPSESFSN